MKNIKVLNKPYNDESLEWNEDTNRYQATLNLAKNLFEVCPIKSDRELQRVIKNLASSIYHYIFSRTHTANRHIVEFLLNNTENGRKFLKEVFECQLESELQYTYGDITKVPVINVQTGQEGNRENYSQNAISIATQQIIEDSAAFFGGINLLLQVQYPSTLFIQMYNYTQGE